MIHILLVDDQKLIRQGMQTLLNLESDLEVVGQASNGHEALAAVEQLQPDVVLMDIRMPGMDGVAATRVIVVSAPEKRLARARIEPCQRAAGRSAATAGSSSTRSRRVTGAPVIPCATIETRTTAATVQKSVSLSPPERMPAANAALT